METTESNYSPGSFNQIPDEQNNVVLKFCKILFLNLTLKPHCS